MNGTPIRQEFIPNPPDALDDLTWLRYIGRYWMKYLKPSEFMLLMFIADRTLGWQKEEEIITRRHMMKGVVSLSKAYHLGTSLGASTIDNALNSLERKKMISRRPVMRGMTRYIEYTINSDWTPDCLTRTQKYPEKRKRMRAAT
jgi:hypothetical protein